MAIVKSSIIEDSVQIDGRRYVTEHHIDDAGFDHFVSYMAEEKVDAAEMLPIRAAQIEEAIAVRDADFAAKQQAEKERAVELLKLPDDSLAKVLMVPTDQVEKEKAELEKKAEAAIDAKVKVK